MDHYVHFIFELVTCMQAFVFFFSSHLVTISEIWCIFPLIKKNGCEFHTRKAHFTLKFCAKKTAYRGQEKNSLNNGLKWKK
jgi:hypothetical protein